MGKQTEFQYDELQMFFGDDYKVSDYITIHQPTVGEIMEFGERRYYSMLTQLCAIPKVHYGMCLRLIGIRCLILSYLHLIVIL